MVKGSLMTDQQYFQMELDSSSSLKLFSDDRRKYYRKYILKEELRENETEETKALKTGNLVDCLLLNEEEFDQKFYVTKSPKEPSGKMLAFTNALFKHTRENTDDEGIIQATFEELCKLAYEDSKYDRSLENVISNFKKSGAEEYFVEKRKSFGKSIITEQDYTNATNIVNELKSNDFTYDIFRRSDNKMTQFVVEEFDLFGLKMKCKMDLVTFDHKLKTIQIDDVKITYSVENFKRDYFLYRKAYIQAFVYMKAMEFAKKELGYEQYMVLPPRFIVADSINYYAPLVFNCTQKTMQDAENGFVEFGYQYPGVRNLVKDLLWAKKNNVWRISRENYESKAQITL